MEDVLLDELLSDFVKKPDDFGSESAAELWGFAAAFNVSWDLKSPRMV